MALPKKDIIEELAKDYAAYPQIDLNNQMKQVHDAVEDMMSRLEEFESIIGMIQTEGAECMSGHLPRIQAIRPKLMGLCERIDTLESVVARANVDLTALEAAVETAEAELVTDSKFGMLNPLSFFKKSTESAATSRTTHFEPPAIFKTDDYFKNSD